MTWKSYEKARGSRVRGQVKVLTKSAGWTWDHTGTRQSDLYTLDTPQGVLRFDSYARWEVGDVRNLSYEVLNGWMRFPRPLKKAP
jgi:hypothetical protein